MLGYANGLLRIDLRERTYRQQQLEEQELRKYVGGVGIGAKILYEEVDPKIGWDDPKNKLIFATGPLTGTFNPGSGTFCVITKGVLTGGASSSQANGYFGTFLKFNGWDGIVFEEKSNDWIYLYINGSDVEFRNAKHLLGLDTAEVEEKIKNELSADRVSVYSIGPAGENLVRFSCIVGDEGHVAAHNGVGAVMGAKKIKAVVVQRMKGKIEYHNKDKFVETCKKQRNTTLKTANAERIGKYGTAGGLANVYSRGVLPIKNYTTNILKDYEKLTGQYIREHFKIKPTPCWACPLKFHCHQIELEDGPLKGMKAEEPEYEAMASLGAQLGITDTQKVVELTNYTDRLGIDLNETGWVIGWAMECYEKGVFSKEQLGDLELNFGNADSAIEIMKSIAYRIGLGNLLAEGVKVAAENVGGEAKNWAVYTEKGNTPRGHDHRGDWFELLDTCVSNTGTIESTGRTAQPEQHDIEKAKDPFDWREVVRQNVELNGRRVFEDCLVICGFCNEYVELMVEAVNNATGWDMTLDDAMKVGRRIINLLRDFNIRAGIYSDRDRPSIRYGSVPKDGPAQGKNIMENWSQMTGLYYEMMGWDEKGKPLSKTLKELELK